MGIFVSREDNSESHIPAVVFKRNRSKTYIALELEEFLKLIGDTNVRR